MAPARLNKKKSAAAAAKKKPAPEPKRKAAPPRPEKRAVAAAPKPAPAKPAKQPSADPRVAEIKKQVYAINRKLKGGALDLVTRVALSTEKKALERRIADLKGDRPFLAKTPKHKLAA